MRHLLVVSATNQVESGLVADLDALVVVWQGDFKTVDTVVELGAVEPVILTIILDKNL